jgi:hypothetical protein
MMEGTAPTLAGLVAPEDARQIIRRALVAVAESGADGTDVAALASMVLAMLLQQAVEG